MHSNDALNRWQKRVKQASKLCRLSVLQADVGSMDEATILGC
jgi:hypothetical protein